MLVSDSVAGIGDTSAKAWGKSLTACPKHLLVTSPLESVISTQALSGTWIIRLFNFISYSMKHQCETVSYLYDLTEILI